MLRVCFSLRSCLAHQFVGSDLEVHEWEGGRVLFGIRVTSPRSLRSAALAYVMLSVVNIIAELYGRFFVSLFIVLICCVDCGSLLLCSTSQNSNKFIALGLNVCLCLLLFANGNESVCFLQSLCLFVVCLGAARGLVSG